eukprot:gene27599-21394_t
MWRFDCSSSTVPVAPAGAGSAEPWSITAPTSLAFRTLAAQSCNILTGSIPDAAALGGWGAVDSAFADTLFKSGCRLFTQFYK